MHLDDHDEFTAIGGNLFGQDTNDAHYGGLLHFLLWKD